MHILHLIDALDNSDDARRLELLALSDSGGTEVCCIGMAGRQATVLRERGITVHALGWTRWLDGRALWRLRGLVHGGGFNIVHVWRLAALRMLAVAAADALPRTIVSAPLPASGGLPWWDRQLLRQVRCLVLSGEQERQCCMQNGLGDLPWRAVPHWVARPEFAKGVDSPTPFADSGRATQVASLLSRYPRRIACAGRLERDSGFREAIWAVDVLRHVFPDVHLLIAGDGPFRGNLESMIRRLTIDNAHLLGDTMDQAEVLAAADVCWVPSLTDRGAQTALEAMAVGCPVVASDVPCLRALIRDGDTGCLVPVGAPVALARQTRVLFADPARSGQIGAAARAEAARFAVPQVAARWQALYNDMAA